VVEPDKHQVECKNSFLRPCHTWCTAELMLHRGPANAELLHANMCLFAATGVA
jgi:hypothetical protein